MQERGCHLNNLFRGSSCLTPGGFLLSIYTVLLPVFKSGSRFVVIGTRKVNVSKLASTLSSAGWYAGLLAHWVVCVYVCVAVFVYLGVRWVTLENRPVERRDSSVCLSLLGCFPRTQEALDITLAGEKTLLLIIAGRCWDCRCRVKGRGGRQKVQERKGRMREGGGRERRESTCPHSGCHTGTELRMEKGSVRHRSSVTR